MQFCSAVQRGFAQVRVRPMRILPRLFRRATNLGNPRPIDLIGRRNFAFQLQAIEPRHQFMQFHGRLTSCIAAQFARLRGCAVVAPWQFEGLRFFGGAAGFAPASLVISRQVHCHCDCDCWVAVVAALQCSFAVGRRGGGECWRGGAGQFAIGMGGGGWWVWCWWWRGGGEGEFAVGRGGEH